MDQREVTFHSEGAELAGTISLPDQLPAPGFVVIHGSDAVDRDGNPEPRYYEGHPMAALRLNTYKQIAEALAASGFAVLRYDKRGTGASGGDHHGRSIWMLAQDAAAAIDRLRSDVAVDREQVGIIGHSEGSVLGALIAGEDQSIAAFVSIGGPLRNLRELSMWQAGALPNSEAVVAQVEEVFKRAESGEGLITAEGGYRESGAWLRDWLVLDINSAIEKVRCPALILQGDKDFHTPWRDAIEFAKQLRRAGNPDVTLHVFPNIDHFPMFEPEISSGPRCLEHPDRPVEPIVLRSLAAWAERVLIRQEAPSAGAGQGQAGLIE